MNTSQLECFLAVAKYLNFSKAAEEIRITQPAVSRQINSLEDELGVKLFVRTSRRVELTVAGIQFIDDAKEMIIIAGNAKTRFRTDQSRESKVMFSIGCHNHFEQQAMVPLLAGFLEQFPHIHPTIKMAPTQVMEAQLEDQKLDVVLGFEHQQQYERIAIYHELVTCPIVCVCREDHPLAGKSSLNGSELKGNHILYDVNMGPHPLLQQELRLASNSMAADLYFVDGFDSAMTMVKSGVGFTLHPDLLCCREPGLCYVPVTDLPRLSFGGYGGIGEKKYFVDRFLAIGEGRLGKLVIH